jgi:hypothetical protein
MTTSLLHAKSPVLALQGEGARHQVTADHDPRDRPDDNRQVSGI